MQQKQYLLWSAWAYALISVFLLACLVFLDVDPDGQILGGIILLALSYKSYSSFRGSSDSRAEDVAYGPPTDATKEEQIAYYKRILAVGVVAFIALTVWTEIELHRLNSGTVESVELWGPIAFLYEHGGYEVAILAAPTIGFITTILLARKIRSLS